MILISFAPSYFFFFFCLKKNLTKKLPSSTTITRDSKSCAKERRGLNHVQGIILRMLIEQAIQ